MTHIHRQVLALWLIIPLSLPSVAFADFSSSGGIPRTGYILVNDPDVAHHLNSFAMIFGHCVWIPPSPKAALAALSLFYGIGISSNPEIGAAETAIASQYVVAGKTQIEAEQEVAWLNSCVATYEAPPDNQNHPRDADAEQRLRHAQAPSDH